MLDYFIWLISSLLLGLLQFIVVAFTACIVFVEIVAVAALKWTRLQLRLCTVPCGSAQRSVQQRLAQLSLRMRTATDYDAWLRAAREADDLDGSAAWTGARESGEYDWEVVEETTRRLRRSRRSHDALHLLFYLRSVMDRGYGGIDRGALYHVARTGTKAIIDAFLSEVGACLDAVAASNAITPEAKSEFFEVCRLSVGRTALALSGGGALAMSHMGVVRTLLGAGLLPRVISGTSGGSIVAAMMALHTDEELLRDILTPGIVNAKGVTFFDPLPLQLWRFVTSTVRYGAPRMVDDAAFQRALRAYYGDVTFGEAFARTGRIVCISVTVTYGGVPTDAAHDAGASSRPLLLNYVTTPACLLWSAVAASCALPGLMRPVTLLAKDHAGRSVPYHAVAGLHSVDGSMASDIPAAQLALMFHVNRTIVSQANPHIVPFMKETGTRARVGGGLLSRALYAGEVWLDMDARQRTKYLARMRMLPRFFGAEFNTVFLQRYSGDVTIMPHQSFLSTWRALSQPSEADMRSFILEGQRVTWPAIAHIRTLVAVEKKLSACARRFNAGQHRPVAAAWMKSPTSVMVPAAAAGHNESVWASGGTGGAPRAGASSTSLSGSGRSRSRMPHVESYAAPAATSMASAAPARLATAARDASASPYTSSGLRHRDSGVASVTSMGELRQELSGRGWDSPSDASLSPSEMMVTAGSGSLRALSMLALSPSASRTSLVDTTSSTTAPATSATFHTGASQLRPTFECTPPRVGRIRAASRPARVDAAVATSPDATGGTADDSQPMEHAAARESPVSVASDDDAASPRATGSPASAAAIGLDLHDLGPTPGHTSAPAINIATLHAALGSAAVVRDGAALPVPLQPLMAISLVPEPTPESDEQPVDVPASVPRIAAATGEHETNVDRVFAEASSRTPLARSHLQRLLGEVPHGAMTPPLPSHAASIPSHDALQLVAAAPLNVLVPGLRSDAWPMAPDFSPIASHTGLDTHPGGEGAQRS